MLVRRALGGNSEAIESLLLRLSCVVRFTFRLNRQLGYRLPAESLEDVVQQVYLAVWPRLQDFTGAASLESWTFGFCRNCLRAEARRRAHRLRVLPPGGVEGDAVEADVRDDVASSGRRPDAECERLERADVLRAELESLDPDERVVVERRHLDDWSFERIAAHLGVPASTVKDRCYRALTKMKGRLRRRDVRA